MVKFYGFKNYIFFVNNLTAQKNTADTPSRFALITRSYSELLKWILGLSKPIHKQLIVIHMLYTALSVVDNL